MTTGWQVADGVQIANVKVSFLFWIYGKIVIFKLSVLRRIMIKVSVTGWLKDWKNQGLDAPQVEVIKLLPKRKLRNRWNRIEESVVEYRYAKGSIRVFSHYKIYVDGTVDLEQTYLPQGELPELPRLGSAFVLGEEQRTFLVRSWFRKI